MQVFTTVISGVLLLICGQIIQQFVFEPIKEFNKQRGDTIYFLIRFKNCIDESLSLSNDDKKETKEMGAALIYAIMQIPFYDVLSSCRILSLPSKKNVQKAAQEFAKLASRVNSKTANELTRDDVIIIEKVARFLKVKIISDGQL